MGLFDFFRKKKNHKAIEFICDRIDTRTIDLQKRENPLYPKKKRERKQISGRIYKYLYCLDNVSFIEEPATLFHRDRFMITNEGKCLGYIRHKDNKRFREAVNAPNFLSVMGELTGGEFTERGYRETIYTGDPEIGAESIVTGEGTDPYKLKVTVYLFLG